MKIIRLLCDFIYSHTSFPRHCKSGNELNWMFKGNCPVCLYHPIESLSNKEYHIKYPSRNRLTLGGMNIYLCDRHLVEVKSVLDEEFNKPENLEKLQSWIIVKKEGDV